MEACVNASFVRNYVDARFDGVHGVNAAIDAAWTLMAGILVFVMQAGFGLVEAGSIKSINSQTILLKNLMDVSVVTLGWWAFGFSISANGGNAFSGDGRFVFSSSQDNWVALFFNWAFCAAAATIVSGAVAGRIKFIPYMLISVAVGCVVFPLASHWAWATNGWLYELGFIDFAGGAIIHMTGGFSALACTCIIGPRIGRFEWDPDNGGVIDHKPRGHSVMLTFVGSMLLWFGWFGFNGGSSFGVSNGRWVVVATTLFNSSLATSSSICATLFLQSLVEKKLSLWGLLNSALAGLVAITPGCATQTSWGALLTGGLAAVCVRAVSNLSVRYQIDDPVDAFAVHGACGFLGITVLALFSNEQLVNRAYGDDFIGSYNYGTQLGVQILGGVAIAGFSTLLVAAILFIFNFVPMLGGARVPKATEMWGNDYAYFSGYAYPDFQQQMKDAKARSDLRRSNQLRRTNDRIKPKQNSRSASTKHAHIEMKPPVAEPKQRRNVSFKNHHANLTSEMEEPPRKMTVSEFPQPTPLALVKSFNGSAQEHKDEKETATVRSPRRSRNIYKKESVDIPTELSGPTTSALFSTAPRQVQAFAEVEARLLETEGECKRLREMVALLQGKLNQILETDIKENGN
ncbi:hypothetical protein AAMO2058_001546800 [Amorphochlora amoebiformis]